MLYTDGISEARNSADEEYGYDRIKEVVQEYSHETAEHLQKIIINDLYEFTGSSFINDDYTALVIKFKN